MEQYTCPICQSNLMRGRTAIRTHIGAKMRGPFPSDRLFFKADGANQKSETVIREGKSYEAYCCESCGALIIPKNR